MTSTIRGEPWYLSISEELAIALVVALKAGDLDSTKALFLEESSLVNVRLVGPDGSRESWKTPLHVVTDWPGFFDNAPEMAKLVIDSGGDPNVDNGGSMPETPLHYAASSDDVEVARILIDGGADIDRGGGSIGTPLANAVGYGCWSVANLLVQRGARVDSLWEAAGLGLTDRLSQLIDKGKLEKGPDGGVLGDAFTKEELDQALWHACQGGNVRATKLLLANGASFEGKPDYVGDQSHEDVARSLGTQRQYLVEFIKRST